MGSMRVLAVAMKAWTLLAQGSLIIFLKSSPLCASVSSSIEGLLAKSAILRRAFLWHFLPNAVLGKIWQLLDTL